MGATTKKDRRYKIRSEFDGSPNGPSLVLRFCGAWVGRANDDAEGSSIIDTMKRAHDTARMALHGEPTNDLNNAMHGYMTCALWSSNDDEGDPLDDEHDIDDIDSKTRDAMRETVASFCAANAAEVAIYIAYRVPASAEYTAWECLGHDLWLEQNGHGVGFGDRDDVPEATRTHLAYHAGRIASTDLCVGDDGRIYA